VDLGLKERTALVLASTSGLGRACAAALASEGVRVAVNGRNRERVRATVDALPASVGISHDLAADGAAAVIVQRASEALGSIDILVLNAGGPPAGAAVGLTRHAMQAALNALLLTQIEAVNLVVDNMQRRHWGRIIAVGSSGVQAPLPALAASNAARGALAGYLKTLASEVAPAGVTVNMVLPGRFDTPRVRELDRLRADANAVTPAEIRSQSERAIPARHYGEPAQFGSLVCFLAGESAGYITGAQIRCDGGLIAAS
jgi:3-oxoacyl-[acyl-carrier protein] reductase